MSKKEPQETRVLEVRRTVKRVIDEKVSSEKMVFELVDGRWELHMPAAGNFSVQQLEDALTQLKKLESDNSAI